jgi:ABC-type glycerol-3-phosphate transport system substrate-binding protein
MTATNPWTRRELLQVAGLAAVGVPLAACASEPASPGAGTGSATAQEPTPTFQKPATALSGSLSILLWSHFVPSHDKWFDTFATDWGKQVGVDVRVDHIDVGNVPAQIASELQAGQGHDLMQYIATLSQFEPGVLDLTDVTEEASKRYGEQLAICRESSFNPNTDKFYAYAPGWVPDPGNFRRSLWEPVGLANGPSTWDELLDGASEIKSSKNVQVGLGMSQEIDSNMAGHALMWSFGASIQDESEKVILNSPETIAAVEFMKRLYEGAMTPEVFSWNAASNNQGLVAGKLSYILNSISAWRTSQEVDPAIADDVFFTKALRGPKDARAAQHVLYNYIVPTHAKNPDAAKEFLLHYTDNWALATYHSKLYDFPSFPKLSPDLGTWLKNDPFGAKPADKLSFLGGVDQAVEWSASIGHPGPSSPAIGEILGTYVIPNMFARAARGQMTPAQTVQTAHQECDRVFNRWRQRGLVGG